MSPRVSLEAHDDACGAPRRTSTTGLFPSHRALSAGVLSQENVALDVGAYRSAVEANPALCDAWFSLGLAERVFDWELNKAGCNGPILYSVAEAV